MSLLDAQKHHDVVDGEAEGEAEHGEHAVYLDREPIQLAICRNLIVLLIQA